MTLLKDLEIEEAMKYDNHYIQTFHLKNNPCFNGAIIPSLKKEFVLFHGSSAGGETYEEENSVHLRYYFHQQRVKNISVRLGDGTEYRSPEQNESIIKYLANAEKNGELFPGKTIKKIEPYESIR